jgi:hypothetical protein
VRTFRYWIDRNRNMIDPRWVRRLERELSKVHTDTVPGVVGAAMWMFNMISNMGVLATVGLDGYKVLNYSGFDEESTNRLLISISAALHLQLIPPEMVSDD